MTNSSTALQSLRRLCLFVREVVWQRFHNEHNCLTIAGDLSYITVVALTPCFILFAWLWTKFPVVQQQMIDYLSAIAIGPDSSLIQEYLGNFKTNAEQMGGYGIVILVAIVLYFLFALQKAMDRIFHTHTRFSPDRLTSRLLHCFVVLPVAALILVSFLSMAVSWVADFHVPMVGAFLKWVGDIPRLVLELAFFTILYKFGPSRPVRFGHAIIGALLAMILMELLRFSFVRFTSYASYEALYGAFKTLPMLMLWLWLFWIAALLGAVLTAALPDYSRVTDLVQSRNRAAFVDCLEILFQVWLVRSEQTPSTQRLHTLTNGLSLPRLIDLLHLLAHTKYLHYAQKDDTISLHIWEDRTLMELFRDVDPSSVAVMTDTASGVSQELSDLLKRRTSPVGRTACYELGCTLREFFQARDTKGLPAPKEVS